MRFLPSSSQSPLSSTSALSNSVSIVSRTSCLKASLSLSVSILKFLSFLCVFFDCFCRHTILPAVSHLRYTESAKSSRAETIQDAYNRTFEIGQLTGSDYIQRPMECYVLDSNKFSSIYQTRNVLEVQ